MIPNAFLINRGKLNHDGLAERSLEFKANNIIIVYRRRGGPGKIEFFQRGPEGLIQIPPILLIAGVRLQREFKSRPRPIKSLIISTQPNASKQIERIANFFSNFLMTQTTMKTLKNQPALHISSDTLLLTQITFILFPEAEEVGPRITISQIVWET